MAGRLPRRDRVAAGLTVAVASGLVAVLAVRVRGRTGPLHVDAVGLRYLGRPAVSRHLAAYSLQRLDGSMILRGLVWFGSPWAVVLTITALAVVAIRWRDWPAAALAVAGPAAAGFVTEVVLKPLVNRTGPGGHNYFPSGHVTAVASFTVVALVLLDRHLGRRAALIALPLLSMWVGAVALALVQLHAHYLTDVVGGACVGVAAVLALLLVVDHGVDPRGS